MRFHYFALSASLGERPWPSACWRWPRRAPPSHGPATGSNQPIAEFFSSLLMRYGAFVGGLICIALVVVGFAAFARADMVQDWRNPVNYPARVLAVIWNSGRLDANSPMKFGAWTVHFDSETPLVADLTELFGKPLQIGIGNPKAQITLKCSNAIVGERRCVLIFGFNPDRCSLDTYSYFDISVGQADMQLIDIPCPTALDLQR